MVIVYVALVCLGFVLVGLLNIIIAASKKRKHEQAPESYEKFVSLEEERQAEARDIILKHPK
jgi:hypothetical protein